MDGSGSTDDYGIVNYKWSFGDNTTASTSVVSTTSHIYAAKGNYKVTLTVVDAAGLSNSQSQNADIKH